MDSSVINRAGNVGYTNSLNYNFRQMITGCRSKYNQRYVGFIIAESKMDIKMSLVEQKIRTRELLTEDTQFEESIYSKKTVENDIQTSTQKTCSARCFVFAVSLLVYSVLFRVGTFTPSS